MAGFTLNLEKSPGHEYANMGEGGGGGGSFV